MKTDNNRTIIVINNLGFSAECAGSGCNSAVCAVDIQLWFFLNSRSGLKLQAAWSLQPTGNDYGCISQVQRSFLAVWSCILRSVVCCGPMGSKKINKLHYYRKEVQGNGPYIINRPGGAFCVIFLALKTSYWTTSYTSGLSKVNNGKGYFRDLLRNILGCFNMLWAI